LVLQGFITKTAFHYGLVTEKAMITLRIDVDYPYPSRLKSFLCVALRVRRGKGDSYLKNACRIAKMVNVSSKPVKVYWFFTPYTIPDKRLLDLLIPEKHEVALHIATKPFEEWKNLEEKTGRKVKYYTIHGTSNWFTKKLWGRKLNQAQAEIPPDFPLISLHDTTKFTTMSLDRERYIRGYDDLMKDIGHWTQHSVVLSVHPEWLFKKNDKTQRGPYYDVLKTILDVDLDLDC
jgi:hypothetical protein